MKLRIAALLPLFLTFGLTASAQQPRPARENQRPPDLHQQADSDRNGLVERGEFDRLADSIFADLDKNADGAIDENELPLPRRSSDALPPPTRFLLKDLNNDGKITRAEFDENARKHFEAVDQNSDGAISRDEAESFGDKARGQEFPPPPLPPPAVEFLGAEMRFGDKLIKNAAFSAEIVIENSRRLFDGSIIKTETRGMIYRDSAGRTRREQTLDAVGGFSLGAQAQKLIFITEAGEGTQYFIDSNRKTARRIPLADAPPATTKEADKGKSESLGTKNLEGVQVEGTRVTYELPAGRFGNEKPLQTIVERWFSPELQTVVLSRHVDPLAGEHVFRLTNIKRSEPARELFAVPSDYRIENPANGRRNSAERKQ